MKNPVKTVSSWQIALSPVEQQIILRPWVTKPGEVEQPAQHLALSLEVARLLQRQLAESIRLLEEQSGNARAPTERRKAEQRVPNDRRKARHFEGSCSSHADPQHVPDPTMQQKRQK